MPDLPLGPLLAEGKTKQVFAHPSDPALALLLHKDGITASDGARRSVIVGKGALAGRTTANVFRLLNRVGIPTHFVEAPAANCTVVRRCQMLPLEVVIRRRATGSYLRRYPQISEGHRFATPLIEYFLKDDQRHDPQISEVEIVARGLASAAELFQIEAMAQAAFAALEHAWYELGISLIDLKIEFGRTPAGALLVADVIDNDSWRIWPRGDKAQMLDKQVYRNAAVVDEALLDAIRARYAQVADLTDRF